MAKKGGVQQLQADINSDDDFEKFLEKSGLLVLDVYSEWCGPCLGMVGSLKKIKLELGGDNLHLAICKSDTISYLSRFRNKSEPTWLFVTGGKAVNLMFGTSVPKLMKLIEEELGLLNNTNRPMYEITELQPDEVVRKRKKDDALLAAERVELKEKERKRREYLNYVTDTVMENLPDFGVSLFGPQVNRDMFKKIMEPADSLKIQCKDRKVTQVSRENFDLINYACDNPLEPDVLKQLDQKELLLCFWKMPEENRRPVEELLTIYAVELTKKRSETKADDAGEEVQSLPPILAPIEVTYQIELQDEEPGGNCMLKNEKSEKSLTFEPEDEPDAALEIETEDGNEEGAELQLELDLNETNMPRETTKEVVAPKTTTVTKTVLVPPIWVPNNQRTHAAMIYVFFRHQTAAFLPPDPIPEPPHIIMAFDAYKKKDLVGIAEGNREDIPLYGFFTSDDANNTQYLANSAVKYMQGPHASSDKIVLKVNKQTPDTMLLLAAYGPSYVSPNTVIGHEEALKFFPKTYKTAQQEEEDLLNIENAEPKKKKKSKKSGRPSERSSISKAAPGEESAAPEDAGAPGSGEEGTTTTSGEESGDSLRDGEEIEGEADPDAA